MIMFIEMDENVTLADQLQKGGKDDRRSVISRNKFNVKPDDVRGLLEAWAADAAYLKQKLGFISAQLHWRYIRQLRVCQLCGVGICGILQSGYQ